MNRKKISCIIPAYNEEKTVIKVINSVKKSRVFDEIIVVNDGSEDKTAEVLSREKGIIFINLPRNVGKGGAVWHGIQNATGEIIVMIDADLIGLTKLHFRKLINPLLNNESDVCIGIIRHKKQRFRSLAQKVGSDLSGQQAFFKKDIMGADIKSSKFGLEITLKNHFKKKNLRIKKLSLDGVIHVMKEEKMGFKQGFVARMKMYREFIAAIFVILKLK